MGNEFFPLPAVRSTAGGNLFMFLVQSRLAWWWRQKHSSFPAWLQNGSYSVWGWFLAPLKRWFLGGGGSTKKSSNTGPFVFHAAGCGKRLKIISNKLRNKQNFYGSSVIHQKSIDFNGNLNTSMRKFIRVEIQSILLCISHLKRLCGRASACHVALQALLMPKSVWFPSISVFFMFLDPCIASSKL